MAEVNLITGCAKGRVGSLQFQSRGLKCMVRGKQPSGLYNQQALEVNAPILKALSAQYHLWARYMINNFKTDYAKPQAVWNYYTECNKRFYENPESEFIGQCVNKGEYPLLPKSLLKIGDTAEKTTFEWQSEVPSFYRDMQVLIMVWKQTSNISNADKHLIDVSNNPANVPIVGYDENDYCMAFIVVPTDDGYELITGASIATIETSQEAFWEIPTEIAARLAKINYNSIGIQGTDNTMTVNLADIPQEFQKYGVQIEWKKNFNIYNAGQVLEAPLMASYSYGWRDITYNANEVIGIARLWDLAENKARSTDIEVKSNLLPKAATYYGIDEKPNCYGYLSDERQNILHIDNPQNRVVSVDNNYGIKLTVTSSRFGLSVPYERIGNFGSDFEIATILLPGEDMNAIGTVEVIDKRTNVTVSTVVSFNYYRKKPLQDLTMNDVMLQFTATKYFTADGALDIGAVVRNSGAFPTNQKWQIELATTSYWGTPIGTKGYSTNGSRAIRLNGNVDFTKRINFNDIKFNVTAVDAQTNEPISTTLQLAFGEYNGRVDAQEQDEYGVYGTWYYESGNDFVGFEIEIDGPVAEEMAVCLYMNDSPLGGGFDGAYAELSARKGSDPYTDGTWEQGDYTEYSQIYRDDPCIEVKNAQGFVICPVIIAYLDY